MTWGNNLARIELMLISYSWAIIPYDVGNNLFISRYYTANYTLKI